MRVEGVSVLYVQYTIPLYRTQKSILRPARRPEEPGLAQPGLADVIRWMPALRRLRKKRGKQMPDANPSCSATRNRRCDGSSKLTIRPHVFVSQKQNAFSKIDAVTRTVVRPERAGRRNTKRLPDHEDGLLPLAKRGQWMHAFHASGEQKWRRTLKRKLDNSKRVSRSVSGGTSHTEMPQSPIFIEIREENGGNDERQDCLCLNDFKWHADD